MKIIHLFIVCVLVACLSSCNNVKEEIFLKEDGTGSYIIYSDMVPTARDMGMKMATMFGGEENIDSIAQAVENKIWADFGEEVDSVIDYSTYIPDSIAQDDRYGDLAKKLSGFMEGGRSKGYVNAGVKLQFDKVNEIGTLSNLMEEGQKSQGQNPGGGLAGLASVDTEAYYEFKSNKITRKTDIIAKPNFSDSEMDMLKMMLSTDAKVTTIVHLPKDVKKATGKGLVETRGNQVTFEYKLLDMIEGKANTDFEIILE